ncbi:hypothetical protein D915_007667 [Fasciola hepatica]|uniref:Uncharacterized protein n=1 Tax=Fasciola hepatica TaxID=6192 RepID=A0A4E0R105_FASHE|nr:hypothetical protein D915_007667 [Fasciola hepatica]
MKKVIPICSVYIIDNVPFDYLRDYLTELGDPPPRSLHSGRRHRRRRAKRITIQYQSTCPVSTTSAARPWLPAELMVPATPASRRDPCNSHTVTDMSPVLPSSSSCSVPSSSCSPSLNDFVTKRARFSPVISSPFTAAPSFGTPESESCLSEDSTASSVGGSISCLCGAADPDGDCLTDCSSSTTTTTTTTNDDDDTDSVHRQTPPPCHSNQGPDAELA